MTATFQQWGMSYDWAWFTATIVGILVIALPLLLAVAMIIYAERKIWAAMALRRGPNVVGPWGLLQSFADGLKVFRLAAPASGDPQAGGGIPVDRMLDLRAKLGEACGNPIEFLLVVSFQRPNDRRSIPHHIRHDVGQIGGAERRSQSVVADGSRRENHR